MPIKIGCQKGKITPYTAFTLEVNLVDIEPHSWWLDSGSPLHIYNQFLAEVHKEESAKK